MTSKTAVQIVSLSDRVLVFVFRVFYTCCVCCCVYCTWCNVYACCRRFQVYGSQHKILYVYEQTTQYTKYYWTRLLLMLIALLEYTYIYFFTGLVFKVRTILRLTSKRNETKPNQNITHTLTYYNNIQTFIIESTHENDVGEFVTTTRRLRKWSKYNSASAQNRHHIYNNIHSVNKHTMWVNESPILVSFSPSLTQ